MPGNVMSSFGDVLTSSSGFGQSYKCECSGDVSQLPSLMKYDMIHDVQSLKYNSVKNTRFSQKYIICLKI